MKTAVIIDYEKIEKMRQQLEDPEYVKKAIMALSRELSWLFE